MKKLFKAVAVLVAALTLSSASAGHADFCLAADAGHHQNQGDGNQEFALAA